MTITLKQVELRKVDIATRIPFRYGIATLTEVPYLLVFAEFEIDGQLSKGVSADVLPPKWFTKRPDALIEDEIAEMLMVIRCASSSALAISEKASLFRWWRELYSRQMEHPDLTDLPPLLTGFGVSLLERAAIDATCRRHSVTFSEAVRTNLFDIDLEELHSELAGCQPAQLLPASPTPTMRVRHTVGLGDPLLNSDISDADRLDDGLPQSLEACIRKYGITHFKIKMPADIDDARTRLKSIATLLEQSAAECRFTVDGNEFFDGADQFRDFWIQLGRDTQLSDFLKNGLLAVEQPLHRDVAMSAEAGRVFAAWQDRPAMIIDESDGEISSVRQALATGYAGTSHKNCKGVIKGLAGTCLLKKLSAEDSTKQLILTGEDLMNVGPVALLQDLAVGATLGLTHMERNGHHFVAGLSQMPADVQREVLKHHPDLYRKHEASGNSFPTLAINDGSINLASVNSSPFGYSIDLFKEHFELIQEPAS